MLNLENLQSRRTRFDLIVCYKIISGLVCVNADNFWSFMSATLVVILTSCISSSVIVHLDQNFSQNVLFRYGIVSLEIVLILVPSMNLNPH